MNTDLNKLSDNQKKILKGLDLVSQRLIEDARKTNRELVVMRGDKIVRLKPDQT